MRTLPLTGISNSRPSGASVFYAPLGCLVFLLSILCSPNVPAYYFSPDQVAPPAAGLNPVKFLPDGVVVKSETNELRIDYGAQTYATTATRAAYGPVEFYVVVPPSPTLSPEVLDYELYTDNPTTGQPKVFSPGDEKKISALAKAVKEAFTVKDEGIARFYHIARVTIPRQPVSVPGFGAFRLRHLTFRLTFPKVKPPSDLPPQETSPDRGFGQILHHLLANPEALPLYADRAQGQPNSKSELQSPWSPARDGAGKWLKVLIGKDDLYRITDKQLRAAGIAPESVQPRSIHVFSRGKPVPSLIVGDKDKPFSAGHAIIFYGRASESPYSAERAYWINVSPSSQDKDDTVPVKPAPRDFPTASPAVVTTKKDLLVKEERDLQIRHGNFLTIKGSKWVWQKLDPKAPNLFPFDVICLDPQSTASIPMQVTFYLPPGRTAPSPPLIVKVNDHVTSTIAQLSADDSGTYSFRVERSQLRETENVLSLQFASPPKTEEPPIYLDHFRLQYPRLLLARQGKVEITTSQPNAWYKMAGFGQTTPLLFDLTDPDHIGTVETQKIGAAVDAFVEERAGRKLIAIDPAAIAEAPAPTPMIGTEISSPDNEGEYLLIYHPMFAEQIKPLVSLHRDRGLKVRTVDINEIFQDYAYGESTPHALKDFLTDALRHWRVPPTYVCLVGDANSDYRNELHTAVPNLIPAYSYQGTEGDVWASEHWYATIIGTDLLPDLLLGRISVKNTADADEVVRKTWHFDDDAPMGPWRSRFTYASDMNDKGGLDFRNCVERLRWNFKPRAFGSTQIFLDEMPWQDEFYLPREVVKMNNIKVSTPTTLKILRTIDHGTSLLCFFGHGSPNIWTDARIWFGGGTQRSDNLNLRNGARLPFVTIFSCNQGAFDYPMPPWDINISEDMMRVKDGGSVAMFVPAGPGNAARHEQLASGLMRALFRENLRRIGEATTLARIYYLLGGNAPDIARMYALLGDPALDLPIPVDTRQGRVVPAAANPVDLLQHPYCTFGGSTGKISHGTFTAALYDPDDAEVYHTSARSFQFGWIKWRFKLPPNPKPGIWTARIYYGEKHSRKDAVLFGTVEVASPALEMTSFGWNPAPKQVGDSGTLSATVVNKSPVIAEHVPVEITCTNGQGKREKIASLIVDIKAREECKVEALWKAKPGRYRFEATLKRFTMPPSDQELPNGTKGFLFDMPDGKALTVEAATTASQPTHADTRSLRIVPGTVRFVPATPSEGETVFVHALVRNAGQALSAGFRLELASLEPEDREILHSRAQTPTKQPPLAPGRSRWVVGRWDYDAFRDVAGTHTIQLSILPLDTTNARDRETSRSQTVQVPLRILKRPALEVTGLLKTVRDLADGSKECQVRIRVRNTGESPASGYLLGFYNKVPVKPEDYVDPAFLHEQNALPVLAGGQAQILSNKWVVKQPDADTSPTAKVYRLTKSIRANVATDTDPREW